MSYSELCHNVKKGMCWDRILFSPVPRSKVVHQGYRINITYEKEEDIQKAKQILHEAQVIFDDKKATSFSETVKPGDRTLRVIHQKSVVNLRKLWAKEFEKPRLIRALKERCQKGGK